MVYTKSEGPLRCAPYTPRVCQSGVGGGDVSFSVSVAPWQCAYLSTPSAIVLGLKPESGKQRARRACASSDASMSVSTWNGT